MTVRGALRRAWPWLLGFAIVLAIATRVPVEAFRKSLHEGPHARLAAVDAAMMVGFLVLDSLATWVALRIERVQWTIGRTMAVRGATYLLSLLNYAVGQGGIVYYLNRGGMPALRSTGVMLFAMGTTFATLLLVTTVSWAFGTIDHPTLWWFLLGSCGAFAVYLAIIAIRPAALIRREVLAPLFDARISGHALVFASCFPYVMLVVLGYWFAFLAWGIEVPFDVAMTVMPAVVIAAAIPIAPGGLGPTQGALVVLFSSYATGATSDARAASVLAFAIAHYVYGTLAQLVVGLVCVPLARRGDPPPVQEA